MIKKFTVLALSLTFLNSVQKIAAQVYIAPEAGLALNKMNSKTDESNPYYNYEIKAQPSFNAGVGIQVALNKHLIIQSGIFYDRYRYMHKGIPKPDPDNLNIIYTPSSVLFTIQYARLPIRLSYYHDISKGAKLFAGLGGYAATTIYGKIGKNAPYKSELRFGKGGGNDFKSLDAGVLGYIGYQSPFGLFARFQYEQGLRDLSNQDFVHRRNSGLSLSVGYRWHVQAN